MSNFIRKTIFNKENDYYFIGVDKITEKHSYNNLYFNKNHRPYIGDVSDYHFLEQIFKIEKPDVVIHSAGSGSVDSVATKLVGVSNLGDLCSKFSTEKLIYVSSNKVYGSSEIDKKETDNTNPSCFSASIDLSSEFLLREMAQLMPINYNILRVSEVYGQRQSLNSFVPKAISALQNDNDFFLSHQGTQTFDWLYVDDFCNALSKIIEVGSKNEIYNVSSEAELSELEIFYKIANILDKTTNNMEHLKFFDSKTDRSYHVLNSDKLKNLDWCVSTKLKDGLESVVSWYEANKWFGKLFA